jgi:hypothetical protein
MAFVAEAPRSFRESLILSYAPINKEYMQTMCHVQTKAKDVF